MPDDGLTAAEAAARSAVVSVSSYDVALDLTELRDNDLFTSSSVIEFSYDGTGGPGMSWVDLVAEQVVAVTLDGVGIDPAEVVRGTRLRLAPLGGRHRLEVVARHRTGSGRGLSRVVDDEVYVWTQFQPFDARRVFACFDQPDLKASFTFAVRVPLDWYCVSSRRESAVVEEGDGAVWMFPPTPRLPTYATAVCAGPFQVVRSGDGSMAMYARRSLAEPLERNAPELFALSREALDLFEKAFGTPYDGDSYDHVFLPDQPGAMENHGCVTWNDEVLYRSEPTADQRRRRALVLLHEMSHMWFGNLVTPQWWDDLWLSESFADWAASWAGAELDLLESRWSAATALEKERAADADLLSSTHPVSRPVPDIAMTEANFDTITYAKGACMLRQLVAVVGEDAFLRGLRDYFSLHAGGNGSLATLIASIGRSTSVDLPAWSRDWLESSGINTLSLEVTIDAGGYTSAALIQHGRPRSHTLSIGLYGGAPLSRIDQIALVVTGERTEVPGLIGHPVVPALLLDDADTTYALLRPDAQSVRTLISAGAELADPIARTVARRTVRGLFQDGRLSAADVIEFVASSVATEADPVQLKALITLASEATSRYAEPALERRVADACVCAIDDDLRLILIDGLARFADSPDQLLLVETLLSGDALPQPTRWRLLTRLVALGFAGPDQISAEEARDPDPDAQWQAAAARAAAPTPGAKDTALDLLLTAPGIPPAVLRTFGQALWQPRQTAVLADRPKDFVSRLPGFGHEAGWPAAHRLALYAFPTTAFDDAFMTQVETLAKSSDLPPLLRRTLSDQAEHHPGDKGQPADYGQE